MTIDHFFCSFHILILREFCQVMTDDFRRFITQEPGKLCIGILDDAIHTERYSVERCFRQNGESSFTIAQISLYSMEFPHHDKTAHQQQE